MIQLSMNSGSNLSMYHTASACWVSCSIIVPGYLPAKILHTKNTNTYQEHYVLIFAAFEITRNNKCTVHSFQEKYWLVCSSIQSYLLIDHILLKDINCSNHYSNILLKQHF